MWRYYAVKFLLKWLFTGAKLPAGNINSWREYVGVVWKIHRFTALRIPHMIARLEEEPPEDWSMPQIDIRRQCDGCGIWKDPAKLEVYPYPEDCVITDSPINPLLDLDVHSGEEIRIAKVCHECYHRIYPDVFVSQNTWSSLPPFVPHYALSLGADSTSTES